MADVIDLTRDEGSRKRPRPPDDEPVEGERPRQLVKGEEGNAFDALTRVPTWEEVEERFKEPLLPRNAHPSDELVKLDTSVDPATGHRRHDYYVRATPESEWILKKGTVSASKFHEYFFWPFVKSRVTKLVADAHKKRLAKEQNVSLDAVVGAKTADEYGTEWDGTAVYGTLHHSYYDRILNGVKLTDEEKKAVHPGFLRVLWAHPTWVPWRTELTVHDEELNILGQVDLVMRDTAYPKDDENHWVLVDFKHWRDGTEEKSFGNAWHPHYRTLPDNKVAHASFQTAVYCLPITRRWGVPQIARRYIWSFPPSKPFEYHEFRLPVVDIDAAFAMLPWNWADERHLGVPAKDRVCDRILDLVEGPVTVAPYQTGEGNLGPGDVWVGCAWARCTCGEGHKGAKALDTSVCKSRDIELEESPYKWKGYPRGVYGAERMTEEEAHIVALMYEAHLIAQPAELLRRAVRELPGKRLRCWSNEVAHANVLARYVNAVLAGHTELRPSPGSIEAFYKKPDPPILHCKQCLKWAPVDGVVTYEPRANVVKWRCATPGCSPDVEVIRKILKAF
jgi:hypothetical protein